MLRMRQWGTKMLRLCLAAVFAFAMCVPYAALADDGAEPASAAPSKMVTQGKDADQGKNGVTSKESGKDKADDKDEPASGSESSSASDASGKDDSSGKDEGEGSGTGEKPDHAKDDETGEDDPAKDPDPDPDPVEEDAPTLVGLYLYYQNYDNIDKPRAYSSKATPTITEARGTMELYAESEMSTGSIDWVANSGVSVVWSIEEAYDADGNSIPTDQIATIERDEGIVHALGQGDGSITVRCLAGRFGVYEDMTVYIAGNSGQPYVTDLQICDENGNPYANDEEIRVDSANYGIAKKFHVLVTYRDPITGEETTKNTRDGDAVANLVWTTSGDAKTAYVNQDTGAFIAQAAGTIRLTAAIAGAGQLGDTVSDFVIVLCGGDTLDPDRVYAPADELKVVVKYAAEDKDKSRFREEDYESARTWYYSPSDLEAIGVTENLYTMVKSSGSWASMKARGVYFESLISDVGGGVVSLSDVYGFYFGATDEYNPGFVGAGWLFKEARYYYPNMSIGSGMSGAIRVAPMIATQTAEEDLADEPSGQLSDQTRFRLCFGAESTTVNNAQQCIYNIHTITIVLEGAPPVGWDEPEHGRGTTNRPDDGNADDPGAQGDTGGGTTPENGTQPDPGHDDDTNPGDNPVADNNNPGDTSKPDNAQNGQDEPSEGGDRPANEVGPGAGDNPVPDRPDGTSEQDPNPGDSNEGGEDPQPADQDGSKPDGSQESAPDNPQPAAEQPASDNPQPAAEQQASSPDQAANAQTSDHPTQVPQVEPQAQDMFGDSSHRFQVYEMMKKQKSQVEALAQDSPFGPLVLILLAIVLAAGGTRSFLSFRRNLNPLA